MSSIRRIRDYLGSHGAAYTLQRLWQKASQRYLRTYDRKREVCSPEELALQIKNQPYGRLISVVVPLYNTDPRMLWELIDSLKKQTYQKFEVILYDDCSTREETRAVLRKVEEKGDIRFRVIRGKENRGISGNTNDAVAVARGEFIALCDHDDVLAPDALWRVADCIAACGDWDMIYTDEDRISEDSRNHMDPHYKPDFCPDTLNSDNYICHLLVVRKSVLEEVGGLRSGFDGSQDHDLVLRISEKTKNICHLPYTLYSWREVKSSASHIDLDKCLESGCRAVMEHEERAGRKVVAKPVDKVIRLWYEVPEDAAVEAVVFGTDGEACEACFGELREKSGWKKLTGRYVVSSEDGLIRAVNQAVAESLAEHILVLDAGVREESPDFIRELLMYAQREDVAGVTPVLVDRRGKITHGGFRMGENGDVQCACEGMHAGNGAGYNAMRKAHNVSAVSMACWMVKKENWVPLDEKFCGGMVMADLGMRQRENGKWFVYTPHARAVREGCAMLLSAKCRNDEGIMADQKRFVEKWGKDTGDWCYSGRFRKDKANFVI